MKKYTISAILLISLFVITVFGFEIFGLSYGLMAAFHIMGTGIFISWIHESPTHRR